MSHENLTYYFAYREMEMNEREVVVQREDYEIYTSRTTLLQAMCVIKDPLGQIHSHTGSEHCFHLKFVSFFETF